MVTRAFDLSKDDPKRTCKHREDSETIQLCNSGAVGRRASNTLTVAAYVLL